MKKTIVIVDDHLLIAKAIAGIINQFENYQVIFDAENGKVLIDKLTASKQIPDIILLDISMPVMNGFETAAWLKEHHPNIAVIALSVQDDDTSLLTMVKNGVKGYLLKNVHPKELETALNAVISKGIYFPEWATSKFMQNMVNQEDRELNIAKAEISDREREFLTYVCTEMTYKEISEIMYCSPRTIEGYRDALFEKFNIHTRIGLAMLAIKLGISRVE